MCVYVAGTDPDQDTPHVDIIRPLTTREAMTSDKNWTLDDVHDHGVDPLRVNGLDSSVRDGTRRTVKSVLWPAAMMR